MREQIREHPLYYDKKERTCILNIVGKSSLLVPKRWPKLERIKEGQRGLAKGVV